MLKRICALLRKKPIEAKLPDFPVEVPAKVKKPAIAKATTRKPAAKKATTVAKKTTVKKKK